MTSLLNPEAQSQYHRFVREARGVRHWLYWEGEGVKVGVGSRLEKFGDVMGLRLEIDGRLATEQECFKDWTMVKLNHTVTELPCRLRDDVLDILIALEVKRNIAEIPGYTPFKKWPTQAQLVACLIGMDGIRASRELYHAFRTMRWDDAAGLYTGPWQKHVVDTLKGIGS